MKKIIAILSVAALLVCSSCTAKIEKKKSLVVASFYPVYVFTLNLLDGVEDVAVSCMAEQAIGCLHDYQLLAKDAKLLADADVLVINGAGMESFLDDVIANNEHLVVADSSEGIELIEEEEEHEEEHEEGHEEEHEEEHEEDEHGHHHGANSHIWMSVKNAEKQIGNIAAILEKQYPGSAEKIEQNRAAYILRLEELQKELLEKAETIHEEPVITFHEAYVYMARELNLNIVASIESDEGGEPSAKGLSELTEVIREQNIRALFTEPFYKGSAANILSAETGAKVYVLDPVTSGDGSLTSYEDIMRDNLETISKAVQE